jgi:hypothetical protein
MTSLRNSLLCSSGFSFFGGSGWSCRGSGADFMEEIVIVTFTRYTAHKVQKVTAVTLRFIFETMTASQLQRSFEEEVVGHWRWAWPLP